VRLYTEKQDSFKLHVSVGKIETDMWKTTFISGKVCRKTLIKRNNITDAHVNLNLHTICIPNETGKGSRYR
jgi:hypothetical protein